MSSIILTNWTVYYSSDTGGDQQITWTGTTGTNTLNELYSALQDLFDNSSEMDDGTAMSAQTPTDYTIGLLDAGETNPWFIDPESMKHLTGGALQTTSWTRVLDTNIGVFKVATNGAAIVPADVGNAITHADGDAGTLLYVNETDNELWIRPDSSAVGNDFSTSSGNLTCNGNVDVQSAGATTGEMIWSNIFTLGTIETNTTLFLSQSNSVISNAEDSGSGNWWSSGHIDLLILTTDQDTLIDRGLLTIYARQYSKKFSYFTSDISAGGRTPIPLSTSDDSNNESGYREMVLTTASADFTVGEIIEDDSDATIQGIVTSNTGTAPNITLEYFLIDEDLNDFTGATGGFTGQTSSSTGTAVAPTNVGPAAQAMTITFALDETLDIDGDFTNEDYSVVIDLTSSITLTTMNERLKYVTRRGETSTLDGIEGQQYLGLDYRVDYTTGDLTGTIADGSTITQVLADTTTATSEVVAHDTTDFYLMLRDTRGVLEVGGGAANLQIDGSNYIDMTNASSTTAVITPVAEHPFGAFAGGKFFGARGVALKDVPSADANNYELIDNGGTSRVPPESIAITVTGVTQNAQCYVVDSVPTTYLNAAATTLVSGDEYQASVSDTYTSDIAVTIRAREMGYLPFETSGAITSSGLSVTPVWLVDPNWKLIVSSINITFTNATSLITRASGNFTTDGWIAIMSQVTVEGSTSNDGTYTLSATGTTTATITGASLSDEGPVSGVTLTFTRRAKTW